ncbi:hypothetical protein Q9966_007775 [Columba livia]|nr:hypothetical protein Q9966_007775 [Columba livia]
MGSCGLDSLSFSGVQAESWGEQGVRDLLGFMMRGTEFSTIKKKAKIFLFHTTVFPVKTSMSSFISSITLLLCLAVSISLWLDKGRSVTAGSFGSSLGSSEVANPDDGSFSSSLFSLYHLCHEQKPPPQQRLVCELCSEQAGASGGGKRESGCVTAALGNTWSHSVNTRLILQYHDLPTRQLLVAKSPVAPFSAFFYTIEKSGLVLQAMLTALLTVIYNCSHEKQHYGDMIFFCHPLPWFVTRLELGPVVLPRASSQGAILLGEDHQVQTFDRPQVRSQVSGRRNASLPIHGHQQVAN